jgi:hypothetical protein
MIILVLVQSSFLVSEKNLTFSYRGIMLKLCPSVVDILNFWSTQKENASFVKEHPMIIHMKSGFNQVWSSWENNLIHFPRGFYVTTLSCSGGHLGFQINKYNANFIHGHVRNLHNATLASHTCMWLLRRRNFNSSHFNMHNWPINHVEF